jgi:hypothetical protein
MRHLTILFACLALTGCIAGASQGRSTTEYVHDDGVNPVQRTRVSQTYSGSSMGATLPIMVGGAYGYGGGGAVMGGGDMRCNLHPDRCAVIQTATVVQPMTVTSVGGGMAVGGGGGSVSVGPGGAGTYGDPRVDTADLEARIERLEAAVPKLAGAGILSLKQSCHVILKDPSVIADASERATIVAGCEKVLKSNLKSDAASEEK